MNYKDFLPYHNVYSGFAHDCFKAYTIGWRGYPSIESIDFSESGINLTYSVWDDKDNLFIPVEFIELRDIAGVVNLWIAADLKRVEEQKQKESAEQNARDLAEFKRLQAKFS